MTAGASSSSNHLAQLLQNATGTSGGAAPLQRPGTAGPSLPSATGPHALPHSRSFGNAPSAASAAASHGATVSLPSAVAAPPAVNEKLLAVKANLAALSEAVSAAGGDAHFSPSSGARRKKGSNQMILSEDRVAGITNDAARIEQHLALEVKRRAEADKALHQLIEARAKEMTEVIERKANEKLIKMHHAVDSLTKQVDSLEKELAAEREKNVRLTQELRFHATQGLEDVKKAVEHERAQRQEKEALMAKKLAEDIFRLQERLDVERHARESMLTAVREEMGRVGNSREKTEEKFLARIRQELAQLKTAVFAEQDAREKGEEQLAATMDEVVQQVHAGLRALAQS